MLQETQQLRPRLHVAARRFVRTVVALRGSTFVLSLFGMWVQFSRPGLIHSSLGWLATGVLCFAIMMSARDLAMMLSIRHRTAAGWVPVAFATFSRKSYRQWRNRSLCVPLDWPHLEAWIKQEIMVEIMAPVLKAKHAPLIKQVKNQIDMIEK